MKSEHTVILLAVLAGAFIWAGDAALDAIYFSSEQTFLEALATDVAGHDVYVRLVGAAVVLAFGLVLSRYIARRKRAEDRLRQREEEQRHFAEQLAVLHEVTAELSMAESFDGLCRRAIELGRQRLGFERLGLWFLAGDPLLVCGSFGVDENGALRDERGQRHVATPETAIGRALADQSRLVVTAQSTLFDGEWEAVGRGVSAVASLWDGTRIVGCLCADNLLSGRPMQPNQCELLGQYASALGHLCTRKRAEDALGQSEANFRALAENAMDGIVIISDDRSIAYANLRVGEMFGYEMAELAGMDFTGLVHPELRDLVAERFRGRLAGEDVPVRYEARSVRKDGSDFPVEVSAAATVWRGQLADMAILRDITQRTRAEAALRDSEALLRATLESTGDGLLVVDDSGKVTHTNARFARMWRIPDELVATRDDDRLLDYVLDQLLQPEAFLAKVRELYRTSREDFDTLHFKDGRVFERHSCPLIREGMIAGRVWSFRDVTQRHRAERQRRESEELLRDIFRESPIGIDVCDTDGVLIDANEAWLGIFGMEDLTAAKGFRFFEDPNLSVDLKVRVCNGEMVRQEVEYDFDLVKSLGAYETSRSGAVSLDFVVTPLGVSEDAPPAGLLVQVQDITERRRAAEDLREQRDFATNLVDTAQVIVLVLDADARIVRFNRFAQELTGYTEKEVIGKGWFTTFLPDRDHPAIREVFRNIVAGQLETGLINPIRAKDGREIVIRWYNSALRDAEGGVIGILSVGHDITEILQKEEQLRQAAKMEAIGRLAGGVAHDFNNMLAIIQGFADILAKSMAGDERAGDVEAIRTAARRAAGLTRRLLAFGRKQVSRPQVIRISEVVSSLESMLQRSLGEDVEMRTDLADDLWCVRADPTQIEELLLNLAVNARDAMPTGGELTIGAGNVTVDEASADGQQPLRPGDHVVLTVRDTGVGMDEHTLSHAFEPFFTTKKVGEGSGLGLATCYGIVEQSGGHITVHSRPGEGSSFRVYLPRVEEPVGGPARPAIEPVRPDRLPRGRETVLVVEDEEHVRHLIVRILRQCGYTVIEAANGQQALPLGEHYERPIDLLLTDVVMPGMGGEELARRISAARPDMGVIYISGYPAGSLKQLGDGVTMLAKPFAAAVLAQTVRDVLDRPQTSTGRRGKRPRRGRKKR